MQEGYQIDQRKANSNSKAKKDRGLKVGPQTPIEEEYSTNLQMGSQASHNLHYTISQTYPEATTISVDT